MAKIDIPEAKRRGLPVDLERLAREGDGWLTPEDRYALKTHGVCTQLQDHVFMVRVRVPGGRLRSSAARALASIAGRYARDWIHVTTRQNVEFHWVQDRDVSAVLAAIAAAGLSTRSSCGHTLRNVMCSEDAGRGLDEPFDCYPDARVVSDAIVARSNELNCVLPSRLNFVFGGAVRAQHDARLNDGGFCSVVREGIAGYEVWAGGSLGKAPRLGLLVEDFVERRDVVAAAEALVDLFLAHGDLDDPARGRLKFVVERLGEDDFREAWRAAFERARGRRDDVPPPAPLLPEADVAALFACAPANGWSEGVRPLRMPGRADLVVAPPLGDLDGDALRTLAAIADEFCAGDLVLGRDQDIRLPGVALADVTDVIEELARAGLRLRGEGIATVRACTGSAVCALGITTAPDAGSVLAAVPALARNASLRVHVSGCPNSCAQHQAADIGLAGTRVKLGGRVRAGYQIFLGADLDHGRLGEVVGRVGESDLASAVTAVVGIWEAVRRPGETLGRTARRIGLDAFGARIGALLEERWAPPDDLEDPAAASPVPLALSR
jgi:sulfite reductase beta subunit-like hemoprotein